MGKKCMKAWVMNMACDFNWRKEQNEQDRQVESIWRQVEYCHCSIKSRVTYATQYTRISQQKRFKLYKLNSYIYIHKAFPQHAGMVVWKRTVSRSSSTSLFEWTTNNFLISSRDRKVEIEVQHGHQRRADEKKLVAEDRMAGASKRGKINVSGTAE